MTHASRRGGGRNCLTQRCDCSGTEVLLFADVMLIATLDAKKQWAKPPLSVTFTVMALSASNLKLAYLKIWERSGMKAEKWVRKIAESGEYQVRL